MQMTQRRVVAGALTLVVLAVIGLLYVQAINQGRATRAAWMVTRDLSAGTVLDSSSVREVHIAANGDRFDVLGQSPLNRRVAHRMSAQSLLTADDLLDRQAVQVPVSVRAAPSVAPGDTLDVYAIATGHTVLVGRRLIVVATGNPLTLLVPAADEPYWIALQAGNTQLFASKSDGVGVPDAGGVSSTDAISNLSGSASSGGQQAGVSSGTTAAASPTPPAP